MLERKDAPSSASPTAIVICSTVSPSIRNMNLCATAEPQRIRKRCTVRVCVFGGDARHEGCWCAQCMCRAQRAACTLHVPDSACGGSAHACVRARLALSLVVAVVDKFLVGADHPPLDGPVARVEQVAAVARYSLRAGAR
eukprot:5592057-Prymnesium_polylepis.4